MGLRTRGLVLCQCLQLVTCSPAPDSSTGVGLSSITMQLSSPSSPPLATRLLAHKIQSPQEWEAIQALTVRQDVMEGSEDDPPRARGALGKPRCMGWERGGSGSTQWRVTGGGDLVLREEHGSHWEVFCSSYHIVDP